jgi:hypothetical protein
VNSRRPDDSFVHPFDMPNFGETMQTPVFYLAHPLTTDDKHTYEENMDHVLKVARILLDNGVRVIVPWHTLCICMDDSNPEHRKLGLEIDCYVAAKLGRIILSGHKVSTGMAAEVRAVSAVNGHIENWVGVHDTMLPHRCAELVRFLTGADIAVHDG